MSKITPFRPRVGPNQIGRDGRAIRGLSEALKAAILPMAGQGWAQHGSDLLHAPIEETLGQLHRELRATKGNEILRRDIETTLRQVADSPALLDADEADGVAQALARAWSSFIGEYCQAIGEDVGVTSRALDEGMIPEDCSPELRAQYRTDVESIMFSFGLSPDFAWPIFADVHSRLKQLETPFDVVCDMWIQVCSGILRLCIGENSCDQLDRDEEGVPVEPLSERPSKRTTSPETPASGGEDNPIPT